MLVTLVTLSLLAGASGAMGKKKSSDLSKVLAKADGKLGKQHVNMISAYGAPAVEGEDKTLAPYFFVQGGDPEVDRLPLKATSAEVEIAGVIASVRVSQTFENDGVEPIEAVYVFPASTRAAVHAMRMKIDERTIEAKIEEREEAKQQYEAAKSAGKKASLLEQQRPNVFTMNVANIMPGDRIDVELDYSELLVPTDSVYEFVYPTVVGPRFGGGADPVEDGWIGNPYMKEGEKETYDFDIELSIETGIPLKEIVCPSHEVDVSFDSESKARIGLDQEHGGNKDFVLRYRLAGDDIESGVLTYEHGDESFFVMMMEPPERPEKSQIPPREYIFVVDVSGSMHGFPLDTAKGLMKKLLGDLRKDDYFNVVLFAGGSQTLGSKSLPATKTNVKKAISVIDKQQGGGGTQLMDGLRTAYGLPKVKSKGISRSVVVVTDGYVGVEAQAFKFIRNSLSESNLFAFGIGSSVNRALIEGMARAGKGEPFVLLDPEKAAEQAKEFRRYIEAPVLTDIEVEFQGFKTSEVLPEKVPDLLARRPIVLMGKYDGKASGKVKVRGISGDGKFARTMKVSGSGGDTAPLRHLWARSWVELLEDQTAMLPGDDELEEAITALGLTYSLLTSRTSFVAIDSEVSNESGSLQTVKQPLPLPEGVSNYAVGAMPMASAAPASQSWWGGYGAGVKLKKAAKPETSAKDAEAEEPVKSVKPSVTKTSISLTFGTQPVGRKVKLHKRKQLEYRIEDVLEDAVGSGLLGCSTHSVTVKLDVDGKGKVKSVKVSGVPASVAKALQADLAGLTGLSHLDAVTVSVVFGCQG
jgi:Ca-activated chloride channel family protein